MGGFQTNHEHLAEAGRQIAAHGEGSQEIQGKIREANVSPQSWGLLGLEALFPIYLTLLSDLESHLAAMQHHLTETGDALGQTADAYRQLEEEVARSFQDILDRLDGGGPTPLNSPSAPDSSGLYT
ncbi:WXG100 family type VII secretion target [Gandjariella thermophila]|uniref:ESX-1 secretion-associated protein n=1 Tax=Gandjariella thermophila TaxID=1931992 RepID=A0A4D4J5U8_9PSEU|nr:hypothetical protein [Gandjariella thermophila]GDY29357.1 hypothetical protein GTS_09900 [Gandjariella thermophila]